MGGLEERQVMEICLACGGTRLLKVALEGWLVVGKTSCQRHYLGCNVRNRHTSHWRHVAAWTLRDLPDFLRGDKVMSGHTKRKETVVLNMFMRRPCRGLLSASRAVAYVFSSSLCFQQ